MYLPSFCPLLFCIVHIFFMLQERAPNTDLKNACTACIHILYLFLRRISKIVSIFSKVFEGKRRFLTLKPLRYDYCFQDLEIWT